MILQALHDLYPRLASDPAYEIAPPGFSPQKISFKIVLNDDGSIFQFESIPIPEGEKYAKAAVPIQSKRTSGIKPQFLCDKPDYLLGRDGDELKIEHFKAAQKHHLSFQTKINHPSFDVVCRFFEKWDPEDDDSPKLPDNMAGNFGIFELRQAKSPVHLLPEVAKIWNQALESNTESARIGQCLITGSEQPLTSIHPDIKGFKASIALISIQQSSSYESYGWKKTENCSVGSEVTYRYSAALNALIDGPLRRKHSQRIANYKVCFWTEEPTFVEDIFSSYLNGNHLSENQGQEKSTLESTRRLLQALRKGSKFADLGDEQETPFYMLALEQPNPGRFSIRFFLRSTTEELLSKLHLHHEHLTIQREFTEKKGNRFPDPEFPAIKQILAATVRISGGKPAYDEISPLLAGALTRSITEGSNYPETLLTAIIRRIHTDREINYLRAATIKAVLTRNHHQTIPTMLDTNSPHKSYHLGRLFAVLEKIQEEGHEQQTKSKLKNTIRDKYFSSASATPVAVFPRLEQLSTHHRRHLEYGRKIFFDQLVGEIKSHQSAIDGPRKTHNLEEQSFFTIGYYHQRRAFFTKKEQPAAETT